jgi:hypothetical protein
VFDSRDISLDEPRPTVPRDGGPRVVVPPPYAASLKPSPSIAAAFGAAIGP